MRIYEESLYGQGKIHIAGVDEAGRGPLAGPVVAAAVILPKDWNLAGIDDSKKLSPKKREEFCQIIKDEALAYGLGLVDHELIDKINILQATRKAMIEAIGELEKQIKIDHVLIDAVELKDLWLDSTSIIKGDAKSFTIAAASILAKVARDEMMVGLSEEFPGYGFERHKGYGTKAHYEAIEELGLCNIHRRSFLKKYLTKHQG